MRASGSLFANSYLASARGTNALLFDLVVCLSCNGQLQRTDSALGSRPRIAEVVRPSVITVVSQYETPTGLKGYRSTGSGFVVDDMGHAVTCAHVTNGAKEIDVVLPDLQQRKAVVVGKDDRWDLALVEIAEGRRGAKPIVLADSDNVRVGDRVSSVGPLVATTHLVADGAIIAMGPAPGDEGQLGNGAEMIYTDARIVPGASGGPLVDASGKAIGMNMSRLGALGVGLALPVNILKYSMARLLLGRAIDVKQSRMRMEDAVLDEQSVFRSGARILQSSAGDYGLLAGDVVLEVDGVKLRGAAHFRDMLQLIPERIEKLRIMRNGVERIVPIEAGN